MCRPPCVCLTLYHNYEDGCGRIRGQQREFERQMDALSVRTEEKGSVLRA